MHRCSKQFSSLTPHGCRYPNVAPSCQYWIPQYVQCYWQLPQTIFPGNHLYIRAWIMSVKANDAAKGWMGIFSVDEGQSSNSRLSPHMLFWQLLHQSNPEKHPTSARRLTFWYSRVCCQETTSWLGEEEKVVSIQEYYHLQMESRILHHKILQKRFSKALNPF